MENERRFVKCSCQHCSEHIQFDANDFCEESSIVNCPHCGAETKLSVPVSTPQESLSVEQPLLPDCTTNKHEGFFCGSELPRGVETYPVASTSECLPDFINKIGERANDPMAAKLYGGDDQEMPLSLEDARRYVADPRFVMRNPETGERLTPETLEAYIQTKRRVAEAKTNTDLTPERIAHLASRGVPDVSKLDSPNHPWRHEPASPRQVAYLSYMGILDAGRLTKKEASDLIDSNAVLDNVQSQSESERERIHRLQARWHEERLKLYPELYPAELRHFLEDDLPSSLHAYVRKKVVGASEKLTKDKIRQVAKALADEDARWWHQPNYQAIFYVRLLQLFPGVCDGRSPDSVQ